MAKSKIEPRINVVATADTRGLEKLNTKLKGAQNSLKRFQPLLTVAATGLYAVSRAALAAAKSSAELASQIKDMAERAGVGTTQMQVLGRVAAQSGSSMEEMGKALLKLTKSTQDAAGGNKQLSERFGRLGIDINNFKTLAPERQMERLGIAVVAATDKQATLAEVMALVGQDAGPKLIESLKKLGVEGYDALARKAEGSGHVLSESATQALDRASQAFKDLGHWFKVMTAEIAGGVLAVKDVMTETFTASSDSGVAVFRAVQKYGKQSTEAARAYIRLAQERFMEGDQVLAQHFLDNTQMWEKAVRAALAEVDQLERIQSATMADWAQLRAETFPVLRGNPERAREAIAELEEAREQFAKVREAQAEAARVTQAAGLKAQGEAEEAAWAQSVRRAQEAQRQLLKDEEAFAKVRADVAAELAKIDEELASTRARALEEITKAEFAALAPSEQLMQTAEQFYSRMKELNEQSLLSQEELNRAQDVYNQKKREALALAREEAEAQALAAQLAQLEQMPVALKELQSQFEALDATIEGNLNNALRDFVETGTADMKKLGQTILNEVIQAMLKALVLKPLLSGIGGLFGGGGGAAGGGLFGGLAKGLGGAFGGARAGGGPVTGGKSYLVGERGPELFAPSTSGSIIDANKTAAMFASSTSGGGQQNVYQIDARGADVGAVQRLERALLSLAGPGVVERRAHAASAERSRRR